MFCLDSKLVVEDNYLELGIEKTSFGYYDLPEKIELLCQNTGSLA